MGVVYVPGASQKRLEPMTTIGIALQSNQKCFGPVLLHVHVF